MLLKFDYALPYQNHRMGQNVFSYAYLDNLEHIHASPWSFKFYSRNKQDRDEKIKKFMEIIFRRAAMKPVLNHEQKSKDMSMSFPSDWVTLIAPLKDQIIDSLIEKGYWVYNHYNDYFVIAFAINFTEFEVCSKGYDKKLIKWKQG